MNTERLNRVRNNMKTDGIDQLLITDPLSIKWLCGYYTNPMERFLGLFIPDRGTPTLFVNRLFEEPHVTAVEVVVLDDTDDPSSAISAVCLPEAVLGVDKNLGAAKLLPLIKNAAAKDFFVGSDSLDKVRSIKDADEQARMREASRLADLGMEWLAHQVVPGVTEIKIARDLEEEYIRLGAQGHSFDPIVSFGAHGADPHHEPDHTKFVSGDVVLFDVGCLKDGYCADMTRTFFTAAPTPEERRVYETVLRANKSAEKLVRPGVLFSEIDRAARHIIEEAGYGKYFTHRLGHQIGMGVHEPGDVSQAHTEAVCPGQCFSIEPGIYLPDKFGVRIEDLLMVTNDGCEILNHYPKELTVLEV